MISTDKLLKQVHVCVVITHVRVNLNLSIIICLHDFKHLCAQPCEITSKESRYEWHFNVGKTAYIEPHSVSSVINIL